MVNAALSLAIIMLVSFVLIYGAVPASELKRRAKAGNADAAAIYHVVRNASHVNILLWSLTVLLFSLQVVYLCRTITSSLIATIAVVGLIAGLLLLTKLLHRYFQPLATAFALPLASLAVKLKPYTHVIEKPLKRIFKKDTRSKLYELDDLLALIKSQKKANNNRIPNDQLMAAHNALTYGDKLIKDVMTSKNEAYFVSSIEPVGTILVSELHASAEQAFPVYTDDTNNVVGTLYIKDLIDKRLSGTVFNVMSREVCDVLETDRLASLLDAYMTTKSQLFVVRRESGEVSGIITLEKLLQEITGYVKKQSISVADETATEVADSSTN